MCECVDSVNKITDLLTNFEWLGIIVYLILCFTNIAFAVDAPLKQVSVRQRPPFGHGFSVDYSLDGVRHARNRENTRTNKKVMH